MILFYQFHQLLLCLEVCNRNYLLMFSETQASAIKSELWDFETDAIAGETNSFYIILKDRFGNYIYNSSYVLQLLSSPLSVNYQVVNAYNGTYFVYYKTYYPVQYSFTILLNSSVLFSNLLVDGAA